MDIEGCDSTRRNLTKLIPELRNKSELSDDDKAKIQECNDKIASCKSDMASCVELADKLQAEVARLQKAILDAGGPKLKKQQAACDKVLQEYNDTEKALNSAKVAITASQKAAIKAEKVKAATEEQAEECQNTLHEKEEELKSLKEDAVAVSEAFENVKVLEAEKAKALEAAMQECEALKKSLSDERCVEIELVGKLEGVTKHITDCDHKKKYWKKEIQKLSAAAKDEDEYLSDDEEEDDDDQADGDDEEAAEVQAEDADGDDAAMEDAAADGDGTVAATDMPNAKKPKSNKRKQDKSLLPTFSVTELEKFDKDEVKENIVVLEMERNTIAKNANMGAIAEYRKKESDYLARYVCRERLPASFCRRLATSNMSQTLTHISLFFFLPLESPIWMP
jgi:structural maintenance of chromosome 4